MFSYLRPHRRSPSTPTSPVPNQQQHSLESSLHHPTEHAQPTLRSRRSFAHFSRSSAPPPPTLPPIARVSSPQDGLQNGLEELQEEDVEDDMKMQWKSIHGTASAREPLAIRTYGQIDRPMSAGRSQNSRNTDHDRTLNGNQFEQPQKLNISMANNLQDRSGNTAKRPAGTRLPTPPPIAETATTEAVPESGERRKTRLNILNPMSLLARRRTSQAVTQLAPAPPVSSSNNKPSMLYDPSIRGTKVHDFSAPRARRNLSYNDLSTNGKLHHNERGKDGEKPWSGGNHTPVFKEDFDEEQYPAAGPHVRKAGDLTDLDKPKPPFARNSNPNRGGKIDVPASEELKSSPPVAETRASLSSPPLPALPLKESIEEMQKSLFLTPELISQKRADSTTKSTKAPSQKRRSRAISEVSTSESGMLSGLPKHMKSTSSRFSFDMIGAAKQEKILEDRHRQKAAEKRAATPNDEYDPEGEFDDFDYDGMMDDDGLEERIPGVNADLEEDESGDEDAVPVASNLAGFTFHSMATSTLPMTPHSPTMLPTPRDASGQVIGFAYSKESPEINHQAPLSISSEPPIFRTENQASISEEAGAQGLGLVGINYDSTNEKGHTLHEEEEDLIETPTSFTSPQLADDDDDDLYFDDGIIDNIPDDVEGDEFDESVFDTVDTDRYGRPLRPFTQSFGPSGYHIDPEESNTPSIAGDSPHLKTLSIISDAHTEIELSPVKPVLEIKTRDLLSRQPTLSPTADIVLAPRPSVAELRSSVDPEKSDITRPSTDLTHDSLAAYQSALAAAAYKAAANGKFNRNTSPATTFDERDEMADHPGLVPDSGRQSEEIFSPSYDATYNDFNFDDELEDDDIIAAANAEALAYDCDGFYGQEFGFYSAPPSLPSANGSSEYIHGMGGYFGPRGEDGITRSMSGRIAMREPNLTPITERSEYSNRNSIMSLQLQSGFDGRNSITSPGLAQLAGMMSPYDEENMSLGALMKLRRGAWGGSQVSLHSREGSEKSVGEREREREREEKIGGGGSPKYQVNGNSHVRQNSNFSLASDFESRGIGKSVMAGIMGNTSVPIDAGSATDEATATDTEIEAPESPVLMMASRSFEKSKLQKQRTGNAASQLQAYSQSNPQSNPQSPESIKESERGNEVGAGKTRRHKKTGSADSISYMKEEDPVAGERWVLERRRTGSRGEVEVLGREVVLGGRI